MRDKSNGQGLTYVYKSSEALAVAIAQLTTVEKIKPGYGISTRNHKIVSRVLRKLASTEKQLRKVARKWMR